MDGPKMIAFAHFAMKWMSVVCELTGYLNIGIVVHLLDRTISTIAFLHTNGTLAFIAGIACKTFQKSRTHFARRRNQ
jgi:thiol:disulfide interchange protein